MALAIELAAARVPAMTPAELARRLDRSFAVLGAGRRGAAERHQTLRAAIDWSYKLLAVPEQALLARLAVFPGLLDHLSVICPRDRGCTAWTRTDEPDSERHLGLAQAGHRSGPVSGGLGRPDEHGFPHS